MLRNGFRPSSIIEQQLLVRATVAIVIVIGRTIVKVRAVSIIEIHQGDSTWHKSIFVGK